MGPTDDEITVCFTDTETTGLNEFEHYITQVAVIKVSHPRTDPLALRVLEEREWKVELPEGYEVSPEIAALNGYNEGVWAAEALPRRKVLFEYFDLLQGSTFGGQNAWFDWGFVRMEARREGISPPRMQNYSLYSIEMLALPLQLLGFIENKKQRTLVQFFNIGMQEHDALSDIRQAVEVYKRLLWMSFQGLTPEIVREAQQL